MGALSNAFILKSVMQAALFGTRTLIYTHLRLVCTAWRDAFDEVVKEELKHVNLCRPLHLPFGTPSLHTSDFLRSALFLALAGVQQANLELVCQREGVAAEVDDISTVSLHAALLHFMPELQSLQLHVLDAMVAHLDRLLPRSCFLTRLELTIFNDDQERGSEDISAVQPALVSGLLHLPKLKDLCLTMFPSGSFTIQALAVAASRSLTSLSVHMDMDPEAAELFPWQHLESLSTLSALQRLSVAGCLYGPQEVPAALVGLTHLDLSDNDMGGEDGALELSVGTATGLRCLSLHSSLLQAWPEGLDQLSRLVRLNLRTTAPLLHLPHNPPLLLPRQLRFLAVGWQTLAERRESWNNFQQALPTLTHLTALQHLECSFCQPQQILAGLPHWKRLHGLILSGCNMSGAAAVHGMLEHRHISDSLRELTLRGCSLQCVPAGLESCALLIWLDISNNPGLSQEYLNLGRLINLQTVNLAGCQLAHPPLGLARLSMLHWLDLLGNCFVAASVEPLSSWLEGRFGRKVASEGIYRCWYSC